MINECANCGAYGEKLRLFDAISGKGIIKICKDCAEKGDFPLLKKLEEPPLRQGLKPTLTEKSKSVYERLSRISGYSLKERKTQQEKELLQKQETTLKDIVNRNFKIQTPKKEQRTDLVHNFHWVIMRARRSKHITQEQLAKDIAEPFSAIRAIERGELPENSDALLRKLENYLRIRLVKRELIEEKPKELEFDPVTTQNLTIADLKEMKEESQDETFDNPPKPEDDEFYDEDVF